MKRLVKITVRLFSLVVLAVLVFVGSFVSKLIQNQDGKKAKSSSDGFLSAFDPQVAHADYGPSVEGTTVEGTTTYTSTGSEGGCEQGGPGPGPGPGTDC